MYFLLKRVFDVIVSAGALLVLSPVMLLIAIGVKRGDGGPVFFSQTRVGKDGENFRIHKFRTMTSRPASEAGLTVTAAGDSRITPLGAKLRHWKFDELPQLWNILKGEMSFVGPRPEVPEMVALYSEERRRVLEARPGLTDYATLEFRNEETLLAAEDDPKTAYVEKIMPQKIALSLRYLDERSLITDFRLLYQTALAIFR